MDHQSVDINERNLDLPESKRWDALLEKYKDVLKEKIPLLKNLIDRMLGYSYYLAYPIIKAFKFSGKIAYVDELQSIAKKLGVGFEYILLLQLCYEASACCISLVTKVNDKYTFFRTMDWPLDFLKEENLYFTPHHG